MKVTQKKLGDNKVQLDCVATVDEVARALHEAQLEFAQNMGLRPQANMTIAQAAEEKMGIKNLDSMVEPQAIDALAPYALDKKNLIPAYPPKPRAKSPLKRGQQFSFVMEVALKPDYELSSYEPVTITVPPFAINEDLIEQQLSQMAEQYAEYVAADPRPVEKGDSCLISMRCLKDGQPVQGLSTDGRTYTAGEGYMPDGFDSQIIGMQPGETKQFTFEGPGFDEDFNEITEIIDCTVTVQEIQKKVIPAITDAWVEKNMPMFKSVEALRDNMRASFERQGMEEYTEYKRQQAAGALARRFQGRIADEVYEAMSANLMNNLRMQLQQQNMTFEQYVEQMGGEQQFRMMSMMQTREMLVQGYALDALFRHEKMVLTDADIDAACRVMNPRQSPKQTRQYMEQNGRGFALRETAERLKANNWLVEHATVNVVDPNAPASAPEEAGEAAEAAE
ncbi:MAG: trigger factor [Eggerthellaceae bacterium]|nr:trigger factor [Eggerthellaceae bacterium]